MQKIYGVNIELQKLLCTTTHIYSYILYIYILQMVNIRKMCDNSVNSIDAIPASLLLECIHMRDKTSQCNSLSYEAANDVIDCIALS